jgi:hypothetical protein
MGFKQQRWRLGFHEISAGFLIRHWNHSLFFRYKTKLGIVHHQKWDATNGHGDLEQLKIGEMHIRYHKKWLIYHGVLEWWNRDLEVGAFWATRICRIYLVYIVLPWASNLQVFFEGSLCSQNWIVQSENSIIFVIPACSSDKLVCHFWALFLCRQWWPGSTTPTWKPSSSASHNSARSRLENTLWRTRRICVAATCRNYRRSSTMTGAVWVKIADP